MSNIHVILGSDIQSKLGIQVVHLPRQYVNLITPVAEVTEVRPLLLAILTIEKAIEKLELTNKASENKTHFEPTTFDPAGSSSFSFSNEFDIHKKKPNS